MADPDSKESRQVKYRLGQCKTSRNSNTRVKGVLFTVSKALVILIDGALQSRTGSTVYNQ
jgi:hypothetical protein